MKPKFKWKTGTAPAPIPHGSVMDTAAKVAQCARDRGLRRSWRGPKETAEDHARRRACIECGAEVGHTGRISVCGECAGKLGNLVTGHL